MTTTLRFLNHTGDTPIYLFPNEGQEALTAKLDGPTGKATLAEAGRAEGHKATKTDKGTLPELGPRIAFQIGLPAPGVYTLSAGGDLVYEITVIDPEKPGDEADQARYRAEHKAWRDGETD